MPASFVIVTSSSGSAGPSLGDPATSEVLVVDEADALAASQQAASRLTAIVERGEQTHIGFPAKGGLGFWALSHRAELGLASLIVVVQLGAEPVGDDGMATGVMELEALRMADAVVTSDAEAMRQATDLYGLDPVRVVFTDDDALTDLRPRHPRSQAGLATEAMHRLSATAAPEDTRSSLASAALRSLPQGTVPFLVRVVPRPLKDWFRTKASWPEEASRREQERKHEAVRIAIADGDFPELDDPEVTVVIPCYNQGEYLGDALRSVFEQTFDSFEVIVVDDGSDDPATVAVIETIDLPRTTVIRQSNRGLPSARNTGIAAARGRFVVPLDADDEIAPTFIEVLRSAIAQDSGAAYAHCWSELFGARSGVWVPRPWNPYHLMLGNIVVGCLLLRRDAWESVDGYDERLTRGNEDWDLWVRLMAAGWSQVQVRQALFRYRQHGVSMTAATEARFETARDEMASRRPDIFSVPATRRRKAESYPWVTVILDGSRPVDLSDQDMDDLEVMTVGEPSPSVTQLVATRGWTIRAPTPNVESGVRAATGKFVADWTDARDPSPGLLRAAAVVLEASPQRAAASVTGGAVLWRRWSLVDPDARPEGAVEVAGSIEGGSSLAPGCCPIPTWTAPSAVEGLEVIRDVPEVEGPFPTWITA